MGLESAWACIVDWNTVLRVSRQLVDLKVIDRSAGSLEFLYVYFATIKLFKASTFENRLRPDICINLNSQHLHHIQTTQTTSQLLTTHQTTHPTPPTSPWPSSPSASTPLPHSKPKRRPPPARPSSALPSAPTPTASAPSPFKRAKSRRAAG